MFRHFFCLCLAALTLSVAPALAQEPEKKTDGSAAKVTARRALRISDAADWRRVRQMVVSPNGQWTGHIIMPNEGDGDLVIAQRESDTRYAYKVGPGSGRIAFSHNSKYAVFMQAPADKAAKAARKSGKPLANKAVLLNLESGDKTEFEGAQSFAFSGENPKSLAIQRSRPKGRPSGDDGWDGTDLIVYDLKDGTRLNIGNVKSFSYNKAGTYLALTIDAEAQQGNGLQLYVTEDARIVPVDQDAARYKSLGWSKEGDGLTVLKAFKDKAFKNPHHKLVAVSHVGSPMQSKVLVDPATIAAIPEDMTISPDRSPRWDDDLSIVQFGIHKLQPVPEKEKKPEGGEPAAGELADVVVWHWKDKRMQSMQQKQAASDRSRSDLCVYRAADGETLRLGNDEIPSVTVGKPYRYAVGVDTEKYMLSGNLDGARYRDVYVIDLKTGKRRLALEKLRYYFGASPVSDDFLFYRKGHFHVYHMDTGKITNITKGVPTSFIDEENDVNVQDPPRRPIGWTADGSHVLLSDGWDIWKVPIGDGDSVNLTVNGRKDQIRYRSRYRLDADETGIDLDAPVYLSMYGEWTKKAGIGRLTDGKPGVQVLLWDDASFGALSQVKDHDVYSWTRGSLSESPEYYVGGPDLKDATRVTSTNPQQKNFDWSEGVRLVDYESDHGDRLQAALYLPANHIDGKKYPTIVYIYEKLSQRANSYNAPRTGGFSPSLYTSNGYAVLMPDIVYKINDPGLSAKACVLPALKAAIETGVVDPEKVGLHGHSWGGYQTAFLITQTDMFAAAVAGAPLTNLISMYSSIYWNSGSANQPIFESSQGRFSSGYWKNMKAYARNSPVYFAADVNTPLLLLHNDEDGAVDWNQGIEYFNTLRRLSKPVVMLQYVGENHGLRKDPNRTDYSHRMLGFFNHHLKGKTAPTWWQQGIKHLDMKKHIRDFEKANREK